MTPRLCPERPLPPYSYVPGRTPHPVSDPRGHAYGQTPAALPPFDPAHPELHAEWNYALDLFRAGYYWEAHEAWESLWHLCGRRGPVADLLKCLIKWAAAGVKTAEGSPVGRQRHLLRAQELLQSVAVGPSPINGLDRERLGQALTAALDAPPETTADWVIPWDRPVTK